MIIEHPECTVPRQLGKGRKGGLSLPGRQTPKPTVIQKHPVETVQVCRGESGQASWRKGHWSWGLKQREELARPRHATGGNSVQRHTAGEAGPGPVDGGAWGAACGPLGGGRGRVSFANARLWIRVLPFGRREASGASKQQEGAGYRPQGDGARSPSDSGFTPHLRQGKRPQRPFPTLSSRAPALGPALPADGEGGKARRGSLLGGGRAGGEGVLQDVCSQATPGQGSPLRRSARPRPTPPGPLLLRAWAQLCSRTACCVASSRSLSHSVPQLPVNFSRSIGL